MKKKILAYLQPFTILYLIYPLLKLLWKTCRIEVKGLEAFTQAATTGPCIIALWHDRLLVMPHFVSQLAPEVNFAALISNSRDGKMLGLLKSKLPNTVPLYVAHDAKSEAIVAIIDAIEQKKVLLITPDGPRGPRHQAKSGVLVTAEYTNAAIFPLTWHADRSFCFPTWDRMELPWPFAKITLSLGEPLVNVQTRKDRRKEIERLQNALQ